MTAGIRRGYTNTSPETRVSAYAGLGSETYAPPGNRCGRGFCLGPQAP
jgi:hypothetical protein